MSTTKPRINIKRPTEARETILTMAQEKQWMALMDAFKDDATWRFVTDDVYLNNFIEQHFIGELLNGKSLEHDPAGYKYYLQLFYAMHKQPRFLFSLNEIQFKSLVLKIVELEKDSVKAAEYAENFPEEDICKTAIKLREDALSKLVHHSQEANLLVTENKNVSSVDYSTSLFKSNQELHFYKAVLQFFHGKLVVPNVAMSAVLNYEQMQHVLTSDEKTYFFKGLIDCVVIDIFKDYKPQLFIELDSPFHDTEAQKRKDALKDSILAKAGQKLLRIRRTSVQQDEKDFLHLISEAIR